MSNRYLIQTKKPKNTIFRNRRCKMKILKLETRVTIKEGHGYVDKILFANQSAQIAVANKFT